MTSPIVRRGGALVAGLLAFLLLAGCSSQASATSPTSIPDTTHTVSVATTGAPPGTDASAFEQQIIQAIRQAQQSVVEISGQTAAGTSIGSGTIITGTGFILTNDHVILNAQHITVTTATQQYVATLAGQDPANDLALLKITPDHTLPALIFANSSKAQVGELVIAMGNPLDLGQSATFGIISALNRTVSEAPTGPAGSIPNTLQTSAPINRGNSGGALLDLSGHLVGVPTLGAIDPAFGNTPAEGISFAIPSNQAKLFADRVIAQSAAMRLGNASLLADRSSMSDWFEVWQVPALAFRLQQLLPIEGSQEGEELVRR
jgi:S1-C subfamily serine protease